jgi:hypothetical protein
VRLIDQGVYVGGKDCRLHKVLAHT